MLWLKRATLLCDNDPRVSQVDKSCLSTKGHNRKADDLAQEAINTAAEHRQLLRINLPGNEDADHTVKPPSANNQHLALPSTVR